MEAASTYTPVAKKTLILRPEPGQNGSRFWTERVSRADLARREGAFLFLAAGCICLAAVMPFLKSRGLWVNIPCLFHEITGLPCLTCGLTRSFSLVTRGDLPGAFAMHLLGPPLFFFTSAFVLYLTACMAAGVRVRFQFTTSVRRIAFWGILGLFVAAWIVKLAFMRGTW